MDSIQISKLKLKWASIKVVVNAFLRDLNAFYFGSLEFQRNRKDFLVVFMRVVRGIAIFQ